MSRINFSGLSNRGVLGRLARQPLRLIPGSVVVRVLQGRLRGYRWVKGASVNGCWLGSFENDKQGLFASVVRPGMGVLDIGANVGFYTLLSAALVGEKGWVVSFEPLPRNLKFLREHVRLNKLRNVTVVAAAVADTDGVASFASAEAHEMGSLSEDGQIEVEVLALDGAIESGRVPAPDVMKIDVEGAEARVLAGAAKLLATRRPTILLATHGAEVHARCCEILRKAGYELEAVGGGPVETTDEIIARAKA